MADNTIDVLINRRSCKDYSDKLISKEDLDTILKAGLYAANGRGLQAPVFVAVTDKALRDKLSRMNAEVLGSTADPFYGAPVVVTVLADTQAHTWVEDGSLSLGNMMNAAYALGIDSCWIHRAREVFDSDEGKALLKEWNIPDTVRGVGFCVLGYRNSPLKEPAPRKENRVIYK